jgi:uncharacterized protein (DUF111 family)
MIFKLPGEEPKTFEINDNWWLEAGMHNFTPLSESYQPKKGRQFQIIPIMDIKPQSRGPGTPDFEKPRLLKILRGFRNNDKIPPIEVVTIDLPDYSFELYNGFHRFYASVAAKFTKIPVTIVDWI